ncbi:tetratricopeptide repeat protein [Wenyingzhuangia sp. IMCC45467]
MKNFVLGILLLTVGYISAQTTQELFEQGNKHYQSEEYSEAVKLYQKIINQGFESADLYYNMANAYYKSNNMANAIYYYEKALMLDPTNNDIKVNLEYANRSIIDNIKSVPKSTFEKFNNAVLAIFPYNTWAVIAVSCSLLAGLIWMFFFFSTVPSVKKLYFTLGIIVSFLCLSSLTVTAHQYKRAKSIKYAIVFSNQVEVKNAPRDSVSETFMLHEGTKVQVMDAVGDWNKVKIADGQIGWLPNKDIKKL